MTADQERELHTRYLVDQNNTDLVYIYELFVKKANKLRRSGYLKHFGKTGSVHYSLTWSAKDNLVEATNNLPNEDEKDAFSTTFRLYYMQGEPINYNYVSNFLIRDAPKNIKQKLLDLKKEWNDILLGTRDLIPFKLNADIMKPSELIDSFLFADLTHVNNKEKVQKHDEITKGSLKFLEFKYHSLLVSLVSVILSTALLIEENFLDKMQNK